MLVSGAHAQIHVRVGWVQLLARWADQGQHHFNNVSFDGDIFHAMAGVPTPSSTSVT